MKSNPPQIIGLLNGYSSQMSGGDQHFIKLINYLSDRQPVHVCLPAHVYQSELSPTVSRLNYFNPTWFDLFYRNNITLFILYIFRIIRSILALQFKKADIIITSSHLFFDVVPLFFLAGGDRISITSIYHLISEQNRSGLHQVITSFLERLALGIIRAKQIYCFTSSPRVAKILVDKYNIQPDYILPVKIGLDLDQIKRAKSGRPRFDLVFCGRLHHRKGIYTLLEITRQLKKDFPRITLGIVGDGPEKKNLSAEINRMGLKSHIKLFGHVSNRVKYSTIKSGRLFILPSQEEGWGIVIAEALACRTPVIVSALDDIKPIWKNNVRWANRSNLQSFVHSVKKLLSGPDIRTKMARQGYQFVKRFTWEKVLSEQSELIMRIFSDHRSDKIPTRAISLTIDGQL